MKLYPEINEFFDDADEADEEFDNWHQEWEFNVNKVHAKKQSTHNEVFELNANIGDSVWSLVIRYKSGDSFGNAEGKGELIWLFTKLEYAQRAQKEYQDYIDKDSTSVLLTLELSSGNFKKVRFSNIVNGYFEHLSGFDIDEHVIEK